MPLLPENLTAGAADHIDDSNQAWAKLNERIDVVADFGADRTGATDSATAVQAAVDATSADGGIVFFPQGIYDIATTINLDSRPNVNLVGVMSSSHNDTKGSVLRTRVSGMTLVEVDSGTLIHQGPTLEGLVFKTKTSHTGCSLVRMDTVSRWRIDRCAFRSEDAHVNTAIQIDHTNDNAWWQINQPLISNFLVGIDIVNGVGGTIIGGHIIMDADDTPIGIQTNGSVHTKIFGMFFDNGGWDIKGVMSNWTVMGCKFEKPRAAGAAVELTGTSRRNWIQGHLIGDGTNNNGLIFGASAADNHYELTAENLGGTGVAVTDSGARNIGVVMDGGAARVRVQHVAGATPSGGLSGDIAVGTSKVWVNDGGTWKSVAVA